MRADEIGARVVATHHARTGEDGTHEAHLRAVVREYVEHYHQERNHQGIGNVIPFPSKAPWSTGSEKSRERLGGILSHYYRDAA